MKRNVQHWWWMIPQALTSAYLPQKRTMSISVGNPDPDSGQAPKSSGAKLGNGIATLPSWSISNGNTDVHKQ